MPLGVDDKLGPYEITDIIGAGGMGEVYRARDSRLGRFVAIKVCKEHFSERFEHEARAVAALNHPNICTLYDVGPHYLVMELVEGSTLAERIRQGAIPLDQSLIVARQIAEAIEAAHEKGITHRDLKPANIKIKPDGLVKVLDFGLAKLAVPACREGEETETISSTQAGQIVGTAAYMAPEQVRGENADKRADIWAFGVVLYEMLTGTRPFRGSSIPEILSAVLNQEPDWTRVPFKARRLLEGCLEKDPKRRLRDIGDAWRLLEERPPQVVSSQSKLPWMVIVCLSLITVIALWMWRHPAPATAPAQVLRFDLDLGQRRSLGSNGSNAAVSPDGSRIVFSTVGPDGKAHLFTRRLDQAKPVELPDTEGASGPLFSPDGLWIAFFVPGKLKKTPVEGGPVTTLCDAPSGRGASWGEDGNIIFAPDVQSRLMRVPAAGGGAPAPLTEFRGGEISHRWPQVLPGGKAVLFTALTSANFAAFDEASIELLSLTDGLVKTLHKGGSYGRYLTGGHLLYVRNGTAFAVPFDLDRLEVHGTPAPVVEQVAYSATSGIAQLEVSRQGALVYETHVSERQTIQWMDATGRTAPLLTKPADYSWLHLSPNGNKLVYRVAEGSGTDIWTYDWQRGIETRLTSDPAIHNAPVWGPDGRYIVYEAEGGVFRVNVDGGSKPQLLWKAKNTPYPESFSPDGRRLAFSLSNPVSGDLDIWTVPLESSGETLKAGNPEVFVQTPAHERDSTFSPDGHWLAYMSTESGRYEVYVKAFPVGGKWQISSGGGYNPVWARNGHTLFYRAADSRLMIVPYSASGDSFVGEKAQVWSEKPILAKDIVVTFDVSPDGKRAAILEADPTGEAEDSSHHVTLVLNFFEEICRRLARSGQ